MSERPTLNINLSAEKFLCFYYLKEELQTFCREQKLQITGSKGELIDRIAEFLRAGNKISKK